MTKSSDSAWCSFRDGCRNETMVESIHKRIAMVTGIPTNHSEDFQMLKYDPGEDDLQSVWLFLLFLSIDINCLLNPYSNIIAMVILGQFYRSVISNIQPLFNAFVCQLYAIVCSIHTISILLTGNTMITLSTREIEDVDPAS